MTYNQGNSFNILLLDKQTSITTSTLHDKQNECILYRVSSTGWKVRMNKTNHSTLGYMTYNQGNSIGR